MIEINIDIYINLYSIKVEKYYCNVSRKTKKQTTTKKWIFNLLLEMLSIVRCVKKRR